MLAITKNYYLGSNKNSFTLFEKKISDSGKETMKNLGYFSTLDQVYDALMKKEIKDNMDLLNNIQKVAEMIEELKTFTKKYCKGEESLMNQAKE